MNLQYDHTDEEGSECALQAFRTPVVVGRRVLLSGRWGRASSSILVELRQLHQDRSLLSLERRHAALPRSAASADLDRHRVTTLAGSRGRGRPRKSFCCAALRHTPELLKTAAFFRAPPTKNSIRAARFWGILGTEAKSTKYGYIKYCMRNALAIICCERGNDPPADGCLRPAGGPEEAGGVERRGRGGFDPPDPPPVVTPLHRQRLRLI